jgi:AraC family transcriptional regulator
MLMNKAIVSDSQGNELRLSSVHKFEGSIAFPHFSAKYVVSGEENYTINQKKYHIKNGEYVIGNQNTFATIAIESIPPVTGICIDISKEKLHEVMAYHFSDSDSFCDFLFSEALLINKYKSENTQLGYAFDALAKEFNNLLTTPSLVTNELFYSIAEGIVTDQSKLYYQYKKLNFSKQKTNKILFQFLWNAKDFIDSNFQEKINVAQIAATANLSEYHFIRLFKSVFNQTPYQYILQKRLHFAKALLRDKCKIKEVAFLSGFADVHAFSKAFKSTFGSTPNHFKKSF